MLPDQAWELRPGSSGPARVLGQGSPFAHQVSQPCPGSEGLDWNSPGPERLRKAVSLSAGQARGPCLGSSEQRWWAPLPVRSVSRLTAEMFPAPGWTLAPGPSASGWCSPVSERPQGPDPLPVARRQGVSSDLSERNCWGHRPVPTASGLKRVEPQASGRLFDRSRWPGLLLAGRAPWS